MPGSGCLALAWSESQLKKKKKKKKKAKKFFKMNQSLLTSAKEIEGTNQ